MEVRRFDLRIFRIRLPAYIPRCGGRVIDTRSVRLYFWNGPHYGARRSLGNMLATDNEQRHRMDRKLRERIEPRLRKSGLVVKR